MRIGDKGKCNLKEFAQSFVYKLCLATWIIGVSLMESTDKGLKYDDDAYDRFNKGLLYFTMFIIAEYRIKLKEYPCIRELIYAFSIIMMAILFAIDYLYKLFNGANKIMSFLHTAILHISIITDVIKYSNCRCFNMGRADDENLSSEISYEQLDT